jgi:hypothetical protein
MGKIPELRRHDVADKLERPEKQEPLTIENDKSLGEALKELGFLPVHGAKRHTVRRDPPCKPLTRWKRSEKRDLKGN